jgi:pilus assembly protein CpaF
MLQAMNTGHKGSMTTVHANATRDVLSRLENMVLMTGIDIPVRAIRMQIASAIQLIVQIERLSDGSRRVVGVSEIVGMERDMILTSDIFKINADGALVSTGAIPRFYQEIQKNGKKIDSSLFRAH